MSSFLSSPPPAKMPTPTAPPKSVEVEVENQNVDQTQTPLPPPPGYGVTGILRRWRHEDMLKRGSLGLRVLGFLFSLLAFIIMASNKHGRGRNFDEYEEYRYALAIAILSTLYTGLQSWRQIHEMSTGKEIISGRNSAVIDFFGDQITAYLLISAASSAIPRTNRMREGADNSFTDSSAACISMEFLAFFILASSAMLSAYKLAKQTNL
ncbi:CASP-like protein 4B1 [Cynara cardunculus var. scolymus]|uniref:CASP-like protein 4B1 n=1 Tax=Cynara cardunculus var. scolymus TaxID=59895 RepID=UPI000D630D0D|nr:CASP-like protein 4B1 [Cynara cardunculus var. scolymus]